MTQFEHEWAAPATEMPAMKPRATSVVTAARAVVNAWYDEHGGRTEQSEAVAPTIEELRSALARYDNAR